MAATRDDIKRWLTQAKKNKATHVIVVCDTFDHSDYPVEVKKGEDARKMAEQRDGKNMQRVMEVYNLNKDIEEQLNQVRSFNY